MNNEAIASATPQSCSEEINALFARLRPEDVEQFYQSFQYWALQRQIETLQVEIAAVKEAIAENAASLEETRPSAIAMATLAQLQARGVSDLDLLDKMLERGESWLDHTMQLLVYCERFGVMRGNYTEWCEHALEGAYDWIRSMKEAGATSMPPRTPADHDQRFDEATEALLLQKLMSEGEATIKMPAVGHGRAKTTQPLAERKITQPLAQRKITQPLGGSELVPDASAASAEAAQASAPSADVTEVKPESAAIVGEPRPGDDTEAATAQAAVATPEEIESAAGARKEAEEGSATTSTEPEPAAAVVPEPGDGIAEPEETEVVTEPEPAGERAGAEAITASAAQPADVSVTPEAADASTATEPSSAASAPGDQLEQDAAARVAAGQEAEGEVGPPTELHAGDVQAPEAATDTEASAASVEDEAAGAVPAAMVGESSESPAIMDAAHPELEDTQPLQKIIASSPASVERVEIAPTETESAEQSQETAAVPDDDIFQAETVPFQPLPEGSVAPTEPPADTTEEAHDNGASVTSATPQWQGTAWPTPQRDPGQVREQEGQYQVRPEQRPRQRRRFFLWRWLARLWRR